MCNFSPKILIIYVSIVRQIVSIVRCFKIVDETCVFQISCIHNLKITQVLQFCFSKVLPKSKFTNIFSVYSLFCKETECSVFKNKQMDNITQDCPL